MSSPPKVSAIIPVYNADKYLLEAIQSILDQSFQPIEVLAVDDGSTDESAEIIRSLDGKIRYYFQENQGAGAAINKGIELSSGDFIGVLDADDIWDKEKTEKQLHQFQATPDLDMVFCAAKNFVSPELPDEFANSRQFPKGPLPGLSAGGMLIRRDSFLRVGYYDTQWKLGEFIAWYIKAQEAGLKSIQMSEVLYRRRVHKDNMTSVNQDNKLDYIRILRASLDRKKKNNG